MANEIDFINNCHNLTPRFLCIADMVVSLGCFAYSDAADINALIY